MFEALLQNNDWTETLAVALDDDGAAVAATGSITFGGTVTAPGTLALYIGGRRVAVGVSASQAPASIATAVAAAVNARTDFPVTAAVDGVDTAKVNLTARNKGESGNGIDVRTNYYSGESLPAGMTVTFSGGGTATGTPTPPDEVAAAMAAVTAYYGNIDPARPLQTLPLKGVLPAQENKGMRLSGGTGNPDISGVWAAVGDEHYNVLAFPYTDGANMTSLKTELADRWGPMRMIEGLACVASFGTHSALGTLGDGHNSPHVCIAGCGGPFTRQERNLLLFDGISTLYADADGTVRIERAITTYKENALGAEDMAYLDVETVLTLGYLRYDLRNYLLRKYPRHKLASDGTRYGPGQAIVTPKVIRAECVAWARMMEEKGLVEGLDQFKEDLLVERNQSDPCRLDIYLPPDLVNQLRVTAVQVGFRL